MPMTSMTLPCAGSVIILCIIWGILPDDNIAVSAEDDDVMP